MSDGRRPREIQIGPFPFAVVYDESVCNRDAIEQGSGDHNFGLMRPLEQRIYVNPRQGPDMAKDTLLHEVLHALLMPLCLGSEEEERIVAPLSTGLLDVIQRNPEFVEWLCG